MGQIHPRTGFVLPLLCGKLFVVKIFVSGAAGLLGLRVVKLLLRDHHQVTAAVSSSEEVNQIRRLGATPLKLNLFNVANVQMAAYGQEGMVNLDSAIGSPGWKKSHAIRRALSMNMVHAALRNHVVRFIEESTFLHYRDGGREWVGEEAPVKGDPVSFSIRQMERNVLELERANAVPVVLRFAAFYSADRPETRKLLKLARLGYYPDLEPPDGYFPRLHLDDAAAAVVHALRAPAGVFNVAEDEPFTRRQSAKVLAQAMGRRELFPPSLWYSFFARKGDPSEKSLRLSNRKFKEATGWNPVYPSPQEGWAAILEQAARGVGKG
jgi:nucleoside-diphosphate-sugar epimerase